jgi:hypothetical protein
LAGFGQISSLGTLSLDVGNLLKLEGSEVSSKGDASIKAKDLEITTLELSGKKKSQRGNTSKPRPGQRTMEASECSSNLEY